MKNVILVIIAVAAIGGAGFMVMKNTSGGGPNEESINRTEFFTCKNDACGHDFSLTMREYAKAKSEGGNPQCPECSSRKTSMMAMQCPECEKNVDFVGHAGVPSQCEHCGHKLTTGNTEDEDRKRQFDEEIMGDG